MEFWSLRLTGIRLVEMTKLGKELRFSTDAKGSAAGFSIRIRQIRCDLQPISTTTDVIDGRTTTTVTEPPSTSTSGLPCPVTSNPFLPTTSKPFYRLSSSLAFDVPQLTTRRQSFFCCFFLF